MTTFGLNDLISYGRETCMGKLMREHWIPATRSVDLVNNGAPTRVRLLGEDLVAFRDSEGRVGVLNEACPHRRVSLALGRNEDCGLRCLFHGWKMDVTGHVVDTPNESIKNFGDRIPSTGHEVAEAGGIVWVYLGDGTPPPLPALPFTRLPEGHTFLMPGLIHSNWLAVIEAGFDQAHVRILHKSSLAETYGHESMATSMLSSGETGFDFETQPYGGSWRFFEKLPDGATRTIRTGEYVFPFWDLIGLSPVSEDGTAILLQVPVDDQTTMLWGIFYNTERPLDLKDTGTIFASYCDEGASTFRTRFPFDREGLWGQDRAAMENHWTGIGLGRGGVGLFFEDIALLESIATTDRSGEHLGPSDALITRLRHRMIEALRAYDAGEVPTAGVDVSDVHPFVES